MERTEETSVTVATFNVLAPCYNEREGGRQAARRRRQWEERHRTRVIKAIAELGADVVCLQEFWFSPDFLTLYETDMARLGYQAVTLRRTKHKEDGVATFVKTEFFDIVAKHNAPFADSGDRVALLVLLRARQNGALFLITNTHLTFPHHDYDRQMRQKQIRKTVYASERFLIRNKLKIPVIIAGDLNGNKDDPVYSIMQEAGYSSSFAVHNSREVGVTHHNHNDEDVGVDYIFFRNVRESSYENGDSNTAEPEHIPDKWRAAFEDALWPIQLHERPEGWKVSVAQSFVYPANEPDDKWLESFGDISDHRPVVTRFAFHST